MGEKDDKYNDYLIALALPAGDAVGYESPKQSMDPKVADELKHASEHFEENSTDNRINAALFGESDSKHDEFGAWQATFEQSISSLIICGLVCTLIFYFIFSEYNVAHA